VSSVKRIQLARSRIDPSKGEGNYKVAKGRMGSGGGHADHLLGVPHPLGRNKRSVWRIPVMPSSDAHPAPFPPALVEPCILAGCPKNGTVFDCFSGGGTSLVVARDLGRRAVGVELNPSYCEIAVRQISNGAAKRASYR
jgi:DNA modification methylase